VAVHTYNDPKTYVVSLTVTDNVGQKDTARTLITVSATSVAGFQVPAADESGSDATAAAPPVCGFGVSGATLASVIGLLALWLVRRR
jgi:PKD repeat protein